MPGQFLDRRDAGRQLAMRLSGWSGRADVCVLGLPRGGVPVAFEVARRLSAPLDVFVVRKLGVPWHREFAMGAIASGGVRVMNDAVVRSLGLTPEEIDRVAAREQQELERRARAYRGTREALDVRDMNVIVVDDGLATGASMRAAIAALRHLRPAHIVVAVPVGAAETCRELAREADEVICLSMPEPFRAVGAWYLDFAETSDDEVRVLLHAAALSESAR